MSKQMTFRRTATTSSVHLSPIPAQRESLGEILREGTGKLEVISERFLSWRWIPWWLLGLSWCALSLQAGESSAARPDVLFIAVDDMNDWITLLDPEAPIDTPHLKRLAARGMLFSRAYAASPACNPSRTAVLTGHSPANTGVYGNASDWRRALPDAVTLPQAFMRSGYRVEGAGKIFHHHLAGAFHDQASFHDFLPMPWPPDAPMPPGKLNRLPGYGSANTDWGAWPAVESEALDVRSVDWCIERLQRPHTGPLFLACGLFRPHMPFFVPQRWLDRYPSETTVMPVRRPGDLDDVPREALQLHAADAGRFWRGMMEGEQQIEGSWREAVRCYQAAATFADAQIGRLIDALDATPRGKSTVIVLWSDHGYQLGEKDSWEKFTLWEKATRVPLIMVAPGVAAAGATCARPVSLLDLYPTLVELCGLEATTKLDGISLVPLLREPSSPWERPAVMTFQQGNHAIRSERYRYIRYAGGDEELYDHLVDPHEWTNLASQIELEGVKREHAKWLPRRNAKPVANMPKSKTRQAGSNR